MPSRLRPVLLAAGLLATGCSSLLPYARTEVVSAWDSHAEAVAALASIEPYRATRQTVHAQGLDPAANPAISVLHFADVLQRFAAATLIQPADVDPGIRSCLQAGRRCSAYAVVVEKRLRRRSGNFWLDALDFKRETVTTGWRVDALLVFVDDLLVYRLVGGHPTLHEREVRHKPLGPLQGWGDGSSILVP